MVRHECGEALGAICAARSIPVLEEVIQANPDSIEIGQTCELSLAHMQWKMKGGDSGSEREASSELEPMACACMLNPYSSVDPAPPHPEHINLETKDIGAILQNQKVPLFERYRAMFSLRNRGGAECVMELGKALVEDESSALLRHEVAYVLGQMQHPNSVEALAESLRRDNEHRMVRHESAEALGAIEGRWDYVEKVLKSFLKDDDVVVRESCVVALDAADYWGHAVGTEDNKSDEKKLDDGVVSAQSSLSFVQQKAFIQK
jgi:deoxyhypusine monooxygenase